MGRLNKGAPMNPEAYKTQTLLLDRLLDETTSTNRQAATGKLVRGVIDDFLQSGEVVVHVPSSDPATRLCCDFLETSASATVQLKLGDQVLVLSSEGPEQNGIVLGRIGRYRMPQTQANQVADHIVVEAKETLTLKCGESSVDLRKDGKLMIRGKDVLSRAKRSQRIKGGTVGIN
jgi:hypothetical protein